MTLGKNTPATITKRHSKSGNSIEATYEFPYQPAEKTLGQLIYDSEKGKILGRTAKNWCELLVFYTIFYIALAALFAICMKGLMMTLDESSPKWKLDESLIGTNPGLGFRPASRDVDHGSLIWYDASNKTQIKYWTEILDEFLDEYKTASKNQKSCDFETYLKQGQVCKLNVSQFAPCSSEFSYGYENSSPCIFLKLNRIYGWIPDYYNDPENLPEDMPDDLREHIKGLNGTERNQIWVSCRGENGVDKENINKIEYFPSHGFPSYYYPYLNLEGYHSPLVAVKIYKPKLNQIVNIECRAWAKNINYIGSFKDRQGSVHFELMIDAPL